MSQPLWELEAEVFRLLGHPMRMRLVQLLGNGERTVSDLQAAIGSETSGTSQQLSLLRKSGVLSSRRDGTNVYYRVRDPRTLELLDLSRQILTSQLEEQQELLQDLTSAPPKSRGTVR